jgi:hypothetical protein
VLVYNTDNDDNNKAKFYKKIITWLRTRGRKKSITLVIMNLFYGVLYSISFLSINNNLNGNCYAKEGQITPLF